MSVLKESELVVNPDGSVYHLHLRPGDVASDIILVGDPQRVGLIAAQFEEIEVRASNREFVTYTGRYKGRRITVMATGIGTDNIDIVLNELDALVNIDFGSRKLKEVHTALNIIRLGTTGVVQEDIAVNSYIASGYGLGLDGLVHFYQSPDGLLDTAMAGAFMQFVGWHDTLPAPYAVACSSALMQSIGHGMHQGITLTAPGFYGPQGRVLRLPLQNPSLVDRYIDFRYLDLRILNFEMETSALYALGQMLGHRTLTICLAIANRVTGDFNPHYAPHMHALSGLLLDRLVAMQDE